jgi:hypothetical protein
VRRQLRRVGVARPPQGLDPDPLCQTEDLATADLPTTDLARADLAMADLPTTDLARADLAMADLPTADLGRAAWSNTERPTAVLPVEPDTDRPSRYSRFAEHRRRFRRAVFQRFELGVWVCAVVVAATMAGFVVSEMRQSDPQTSAWRSAPTRAPQPTSNTTGRCVFEPCAQPAYSGEPTLVRIPAIAVESSLESLSLDAAGQLEPPKTYERAGWWRGGVVPGDIGPAVIAGHVDSVKGPAVFYRLHELRRGDVIEVVRGGQVVTFNVTGAEQYPKNAFPTDRVYQPTPDAELRLITCGGDFDRRRRSYRDNIVVYAALA